jgi:hypothetical protein
VVADAGIALVFERARPSDPGAPARHPPLCRLLPNQRPGRLVKGEGARGDSSGDCQLRGYDSESSMQCLQGRSYLPKSTMFRFARMRIRMQTCMFLMMRLQIGSWLLSPRYVRSKHRLGRSFEALSWKLFLRQISFCSPPQRVSSFSTIIIKQYGKAFFLG